MTDSIKTPGGYKSDEELLAMMEEGKKPEPTPGPAPAPSPAQPGEAQAGPEKPLTWEERIKLAGLNEDQAFKILDSILANGYYEHSFSLYGGRMTVKLRSRDGAHRQRVADALDQLRTNDPRVHGQTMSRLFLAGSLVSYGPKTMPMAEGGDSLAVSKAFEERLKFIDSLPDPMIDTLYGLSAQFDGWVFAALSNGAPSGF